MAIAPLPRSRILWQRHLANRRGHPHTSMTNARLRSSASIRAHLAWTIPSRSTADIAGVVGRLARSLAPCCSSPATTCSTAFARSGSARRRRSGRVLHVPGPIGAGSAHSLFVAYPLIPWVGVMALGWCLGAIYAWPAERRRRTLLWLGLGLTGAFAAAARGRRSTAIRSRSLPAGASRCPACTRCGRRRRRGLSAVSVVRAVKQRRRDWWLGYL